MPGSMLATNGPRWNDRGDGPSWPSLGVSIAITAAAFAVAFAAVVPHWTGSRLIDTDPPTVVQLPPLPVATRPQPDVQRAPRLAPPARVAAPIAPAVAAPTIPLAPPVVAPITEQPTNRAAPRDSSPGSRKGPVIPLGPVRAPIDVPGNTSAPLSHLGAPVAPAGVTSIDPLPNTPEVRDSIAAVRMNDIALLAKTHAPTGAELADLQARKLGAERLARRATTAGDSRDVHVMTGEGRDGVGAVNGGRTSLNPLHGSIPFTLFSSGPTEAQRKVNEKLDAEYQARLRRLQDRALIVADVARRDSARADSLRRDSLTKIARRLLP
jgi:hypothetical protein